MHRLQSWLASPRPYQMLIGFGLFLGFWYLSVEVWKLPRFAEMPGLTTVVSEWLSRDPIYGLSVFVPEYYLHIWVSIRRIAIAFFLATAIGVPLAWVTVKTDMPGLKGPEADALYALGKQWLGGEALPRQI